MLVHTSGSYSFLHWGVLRSKSSSGHHSDAALVITGYSRAGHIPERHVLSDCIRERNTEKGLS